MSEVSTRVWLEERLWDAARRRALAEGTTIRELIPRMLAEALAGRPATPVGAAPVRPAASDDGGPPAVPLAEVYRCGICGAEVRLGGLSNHLGKHLKERQLTEAGRS